MGPLSEELKKRNTDTFCAEAHEDILKENGQKQDWETFLQQVLSAPEFRIVRSSGKIQEKDAMIKQIREDTRPYRREPMGEPEGYEEGDLGVVINLVNLPDDPANSRDSFRNVKIFVRQEDDWKCVYWQVTRIPGR